MRQALERRLGIIFGGGVAILFLMGVLQNQSVIKLADTIRDVLQSHEILEHLGRLDSLVSSAALEADAYAMTGDWAHLHGCREAAQRVPEVLQKLQPAQGSDPERSREWTALASQTSAALAELQPAADRIANPGSNATSLMASRQAVDGARQTIRHMQEEEQRRLRQKGGALTANSRLATLSTTLGAALGLWLLTLASLVIHRYVVERRSGQGTRVLTAEVLWNLDQAVYVADEVGMVLYANRAADALFGYEPGQLVGTAVAQLNNFAVPEVSEVVPSPIDPRLSTGKPWTGKLMGYRKDRRAFLSSVRVSSLDLSGKNYRLFVQDGLVPSGPSDDSTGTQQAIEIPEPSEPLPVESPAR